MAGSANLVCVKLSKDEWIFLVMNCPHMLWIVPIYTNLSCDELFPYESSLWWVVPWRIILLMNCPHTNHLCDELSPEESSLWWIVPRRIILVMSCPQKNHPFDELSPYESSLWWIVPRWIILVMNYTQSNYESSLRWIFTRRRIVLNYKMWWHFFSLRN